MRTTHGDRCNIELSPDLRESFDYVRSTEYATLRFDPPIFILTEDQRVRLTITCENGATPQSLRIDDVCIVER
jgi:hypothetical protein